MPRPQYNSSAASGCALDAAAEANGSPSTHTKSMVNESTCGFTEKKRENQNGEDIGQGDGSGSTPMQIRNIAVPLGLSQAAAAKYNEYA